MFCIQRLNRRDDVDAVSVISVFVLVGELVAGDTTEGGRASVAAIRIRFMNGQNGRPPCRSNGRRMRGKQRPHFLHRIRQSRPRSWPRLQRLLAGRTEHEGGEGDRLTVLFSHSASCVRRTSQSQLNLDDAELHCARMLKTSRTWRTTIQGSPIYLN